MFDTLREMLQFAVVLVVVTLGFTVSFHALFRNFDTYAYTWLNLFKAMLADLAYFNEFPDERFEAVATVLLVVYVITNGVMLLNLLIAVLSTTHAKVQENVEHEYSVIKARLIQRYRLVVGEDLLPAPFNLLQILFAGRKRAQRRVGYLVFWLVVGPVAVCGGALLWVVSAFLVPFPDVHELRVWSNVQTYFGLSSKRRWFSKGLEFLLLFMWRVVVSPLHLFGWWLTRPLVCVKLLVSGSFCGSEQESADGPKHGQRVRVDDILKAQPGGKSVRELLDLLRDPKLDQKMEEERRQKTIEYQIGTLREAVANMDGKLNILVELISAQGNREGGVSR